MPPQTPEDIRAKTEKYLKDEFEKLNTKCTMEVEYLHGGNPWMTDRKHWNYEAAKTATEVRNQQFSISHLSASPDYFVTLRGNTLCQQALHAQLADRRLEMAAKNGDTEVMHAHA